MAAKDSDKKYFDVASPGKNIIPEVKPGGRTIIPLKEDKTDEPLTADKSPDEPKTAQPDTLMEPSEVAVKKEGAPEVESAGFVITPLPEKENTPDTSEKPDESEAPADEPLNEVSSESTAPEVAESEPKPESEPESEESDKKEVDLGTKAVESAQEDEAKPTDNEQTEPQEALKETQAEPAIETGPEDSSTGSGGSDNQESADKDVPVSEEQFATANESEAVNKQVADKAEQDAQDPKIYDTKEYYVPIGKAYHKHGTAKGAFVFGIICAIIVLAAALYFVYRLGQ